jgi:superfamily II DNA or RNA helicase
VSLRGRVGGLAYGRRRVAAARVAGRLATFRTRPKAAVTAPLEAVSPQAPLRSWQRAALVSYLRQSPRDFLAVATPGAGKTTFALRIAA